MSNIALLSKLQSSPVGMCAKTLTGHFQSDAMASGVLLDSSHDEKKRKL